MSKSSMLLIFQADQWPPRSWSVKGLLWSAWSPADHQSHLTWHGAIYLVTTTWNQSFVLPDCNAQLFSPFHHSLPSLTILFCPTSFLPPAQSICAISAIWLCKKYADKSWYLTICCCANLANQWNSPNIMIFISRHPAILGDNSTTLDTVILYTVHRTFTVESWRCCNEKIFLCKQTTIELLHMASVVNRKFKKYRGEFEDYLSSYQGPKVNAKSQ